MDQITIKTPNPKCRLYLVSNRVYKLEIQSRVKIPTPSLQIDTDGVKGMDQITLKTANPKCRLYWCLIEFIDCSHVGIFDPSCELAPL